MTLFRQKVRDGVPIEGKPDPLNKHQHLDDWTPYHHQYLNVEGTHQLQSECNVECELHCSVVLVELIAPILTAMLQRTAVVLPLSNGLTQELCNIDSSSFRYVLDATATAYTQPISQPAQQLY
jgi:hypothetical protein